MKSALAFIISITLILSSIGNAQELSLIGYTVDKTQSRPYNEQIGSGYGMRLFGGNTLNEFFILGWSFDYSRLTGQDKVFNGGNLTLTSIDMQLRFTPIRINILEIGFELGIGVGQWKRSERVTKDLTRNIILRATNELVLVGEAKVLTLIRITRHFLMSAEYGRRSLDRFLPAALTTNKVGLGLVWRPE